MRFRDPTPAAIVLWLVATMLLVVAFADVFNSPLDHIVAILAGAMGITGALLPERRPDRTRGRDL